MAESENANVEQKPVEAQSDGETQSEETAEAPTITKSQATKLVTDRLAREKVAHQKEIAALKAQIKTPEYDTKEAEYKAKVKELQEELKSRDAALTQQRQKTLEKSISSALAKSGCLDPELLGSQILSGGKVKFNEGGEIVVDDLTGETSLEDLVTEYTKKKPYLFASSTKGGAGTKPVANTGGTGKMSRDDELRAEFEAATGQKFQEKKKSLTAQEIIARRKNFSH